jgi:hypothetical protein
MPGSDRWWDSYITRANNLLPPEARISRTHQILGEAAAIDEAEDQQFGESRGDELPDGLKDRGSRLKRLKRCKEELEAEQARQMAAYQGNLKWRDDGEAEHGRKLGGRKPFAPDPAAIQKAIINTTDPDSRPIVRTGRPTVQGYNAQAVATIDQIIVAADITQQSVDATQLAPMIVQANETLPTPAPRVTFRQCLPMAGTGTGRT